MPSLNPRCLDVEGHVEAPRRFSSAMWWVSSTSCSPSRRSRIAEPGPTRDLGCQVDAEFAPDDCAGLQLGEHLKPPIEVLQFRGGLLQPAVAAQQPRRACVDLQRLDDAPTDASSQPRQVTAGKEIDQPHAWPGRVGWDSTDTRHLILLPSGNADIRTEDKYERDIAVRLLAEMANAVSR
jgi:hypothetical protein